VGRYRSYDDDRNDDTTKLISNILQILVRAVLPAVIGIMSRCESKADIARKPDLIADMVNHSIKVCQVENRADTKQTGMQRLDAVLRKTLTKEMDIIREQGITVCLDPRLGYQKLGYLDTRIEGVYHPKEKLLMLYDNGRDVDSSGAATDRGPYTIEKLADDFKLGKISLGQVWYASNTGSSKTNKIVWKIAKDFDQDTIKANPQFARPPQLHAPTLEYKAR
jgi:hypothetical protein